MKKTKIVAAVALGVLALAVAGWAAAGSRAPEQRAVEVVRVGTGRVAWLGVALEDVDASQAGSLKLEAAQGARIQRVEPGSPAEKSGLAQGDVVLRFDGEHVRSAAQLARLVRETPAGRRLELEVWRDGAARKLSAELADQGSRRRADAEDEAFELRVPPPGDLPEAPRFSWRGFGHGLRGLEGLEGLESFGAGPRRRGVAFQEIGGQLARYFELEGDRGLLVTDVDEGSPAAKAGLRAGDVLLAFDQKRLEDAGDLRDAVRRAENGKPLLLDVLRHGKKLQLTVTMTEPLREKPADQPI